MLLELEEVPPERGMSKGRALPGRAACWEQREDTLQNYIRGKGLIFSAPASLNKFNINFVALKIRFRS